MVGNADEEDVEIDGVEVDIAKLKVKVKEQE